MKYFYMPKNKDIKVNKNVTVSQVSWFLLFPNICIYGFGDNKRFSKISSITLEWLYWQLTIQINRYYEEEN